MHYRTPKGLCEAVAPDATQEKTEVVRQMNLLATNADSRTSELAGHEPVFLAEWGAVSGDQGAVGKNGRPEQLIGQSHLAEKRS
jgi:hypothetical protein